jgi:hypothetical protein
VVLHVRQASEVSVPRHRQVRAGMRVTDENGDQTNHKADVE